MATVQNRGEHTHLGCYVVDVSRSAEGSALWKVVKKFRCKCFLTFGPFFSKYKFFEVATCFLA